jgi:hypothetical protein
VGPANRFTASAVAPLAGWNVVMPMKSKAAAVAVPWIAPERATF